MKTGRNRNDADSMQLFTTLAIALAKGAASAMEPNVRGDDQTPPDVKPNSNSSQSFSQKFKAGKLSMLPSTKSRSLFIASFISAGLLAGCMTTDPNTGEQKVSHTTKDAGIGALAGAVLGAATASRHDRTKGILTGAALGGGIGAAVGHHSDKQEAELRQKLANSGVEVQRQGDTIKLIVPGAISFATSSAQLAPNFYESLNKVGASLQEYPDSTVQILGHTDSTGPAAFNQQLSVNRANAVVVYLSAQGIAQQRIQALGMGASQPIADNKTADGRAQNRRVEIKIIPRETAPANS
ncbi:MAG TPA: OmpA family protein [Spongiibacteraceae bacterium]